MSFSLPALWRRTRPKTSNLAVVVYSRDDCRCCDKALDLLNARRRRYGFSIEAIDVDGDPELAKRYGESVPVVAVNGKVRFKGTINPALLDRLLRAEGKG